MLVHNLSLVHPERRSAACVGPHILSVKHPLPRQNRLLAALPEADYARLLADLEPVTFSAGQLLHSPGTPESHLYFIVAGLVVQYGELEDGTMAEVSGAGRDGTIGLTVILGGERFPFWAEAVTTGFAYRMARSAVTKEFAHNSPLAPVLLRYVQSLLVEIGQIAVCNRKHSLEQRLCRWLLGSLDRLNSARIEVTHEAISNVLGVRREGITQAMGSLKKAGLIDYSRGHITLFDHPRLEALACECYAIVRREYTRLLCAGLKAGQPCECVSRAGPGCAWLTLNSATRMDTRQGFQ